MDTDERYTPYLHTYVWYVKNASKNVSHVWDTRYFSAQYALNMMGSGYLSLISNLKNVKLLIFLD